MRTLQEWLGYYRREWQRSQDYKTYYTSVHALLRLALSYDKIDLNEYLQIMEEVEDEINKV